MQRFEVDLGFERAVEIADGREPAFVGERVDALGEYRAADIVAIGSDIAFLAVFTVIAMAAATMLFRRTL